MTGGNHTWDKKEIFPYFAEQPRLLRPANFPAGDAGRGRVRRTRAERRARRGRSTSMGRVFMTAIDDPFRVVLDEIEAVRDEARIVFVDFHAEATSEKVAMGWHLDGRVDRRRRHAHARADRRRARAAAGHGLHHRRRHDRAARLGDRRRTPGDHPAVPDRPAAAVRDRHGKPAPEWRASSRPTRRPDARPRSSASDLSAQEIEALVAQPARRRADRHAPTDSTGLPFDDDATRPAARAARRSASSRRELKQLDRRRRSAASPSKARSPTAGSGAPATSTSR